MTPACACESGSCVLLEGVHRSQKADGPRAQGQSEEAAVLKGFRSHKGLASRTHPGCYNIAAKGKRRRKHLICHQSRKETRPATAHQSVAGSREGITDEKPSFLVPQEGEGERGGGGIPRDY